MVLMKKKLCLKKSMHLELKHFLAVIEKTLVFLKGRSWSKVSVVAMPDLDYDWFLLDFWAK